MTTLRVACIGWGSLLWDPRTLPMAGPFQHDGPHLPIEFSRVALDGRVTLVIDPRAVPIQTYWTPMAVSSLDEAIEGLGVREKVAPERWPDWIGLHTRGREAGQTGRTASVIRETIDRWLADRPLDAVVWTALPSRTPCGAYEYPDLAVLLAHLDSLEGSARTRAEEYIRRAPSAVRTAHRTRFEEHLGWSAREATVDRSGRGS